MTLFIRNVEKNVKPQDIFTIFNSLNLGKVKKVNIVPYHKKVQKQKKESKYNHVYIQLHQWYETEVAHNVIKRLLEGKFETRLCYKDDNWWVLEICTQDISRIKIKKGIRYTLEDFVFEKNKYEEDEVSTQIDSNELTLSYSDLDLEEDEADFNQLIRDIEFQRQLWYYEEVNSSSAFDKLFIEIEEERMRMIDMIF